MSEHESGGSGGRFGNWPKRLGPDRPADGGAGKAPPRGPGWGQGSRFGASPQPDPALPPEKTLPVESPQPKRRRKKAEPKHPRHTVPVISAKVTIHRDKQGTAHIRAKQEHDAWAALGFCCGEDRLWQMDVLRRIAWGRASEVFGQDWLLHDSLVRTAGVGRRATAAAQRIQGLAHEMLAAYAGGVNAARATGQPPEATALEYEVAPWTVADSLALELYWAWSSSCRVWPEKLRAALGQGDETAGAQPDPREALWARLDPRVASLAAELRVAELPGSLGFVTPAGKAAQLATQFNGPPGALGLPYAAHLRSPEIDITGLVSPGTPFFIAGRNKTIAWSASAVVTDDVDLVMEELDGIGNFRAAGGREKAARRQELVRVRGGDDRRIEVVETRHGPLLSGLASQFHGAPEDTRISIAVRWGLNSLGTSQSGWLALARAANVAQAKEASRLLGSGPLAFELLVADHEGQEARYRAGRVPIRSAANDLPVRGWHGESRWSGAVFLSYEVGAAAGKEGKLSRLRESEAPANHRLRRILAGEELDGPGAALVLSDVADDQAETVAAMLNRHLDPASLGAQSLSAWNGAAVPDSAGAAFFWVLVLKYLAKALCSERELQKLGRAPTELMAILVAEGRVENAEPALVRDAAARTEEFLLASCGSEWRWERVCQVDREHILGSMELFSSAGLPARTQMGSPGSIFQVGLADDPDGVRVITEPCARLICDLGTSHAAMVLAGGVSGVSSSVHFADQSASFNEGRLTSFPVDDDVQGDLSELLP